MQKRNTVLVLAVLNALLLGYILMFDRGLTTTEVAGRRGHLLTHFVREHVERVELVRGDSEAVVLVRERSEEDELGTWELQSPLAGEADDDNVDSFLSALEWLDPARRLETISAEDRATFGLDEPRFTVRFTVADETYELRVGGEAPTGEGVYAAVEGEPGGYVIDTDFAESIDHSVDWFRSKDLFVSFFSSDAVEIRVEGGGEAIEFGKEDGTWQAREPDAGLGNGALVERLLRAIGDAEATRFIREDAGELAEYGLDEPWRTIRVERPEDASGTRIARLRVGAVCGEHAEERYAIAGDDGPVVCVESSAVAALDIDRSRLLETRLVTLGADAIERIVVEASGETLTLARDEATWTVALGDAEASPADDDAISAWLDALRASRASELEPIEGAPGHGLADGAVSLVIRRNDRDAEHTVTLGEAGPDGVWARRGEEAAAGLYPASLSQLLTTDALRFRDRALLSLTPGDARRIGITRQGAPEEVAVRGESDGWTLETPVAESADRIVARDVGRRIAGLRAERFVSASPSAEHGLEPPAATITVRFEPEGGEARTVRLSLGAATVDGSYAQLDEGEAVFVVGREAADALSRNLLSLDLLTVDTSDVTSVAIERDGATYRIEKTAAGEWRTAAGDPPDTEATSALLDRIATLRATRVERYGELGSAPEVTVVIGRTGDAGELRFGIGAPSGEGEDAYVLVAPEGVGAVYRFRAPLLDVFRTAAP